MSAERAGLCEMVGDGNDIYIVLGGKRIAKRGRPGTPHAKKWLALDPDYRVRDIGYPEQLEVEYVGPAASSEN